MDDSSDTFNSGGFVDVTFTYIYLPEPEGPEEENKPMFVIWSKPISFKAQIWRSHEDNL